MSQHCSNQKCYADASHISWILGVLFRAIAPNVSASNIPERPWTSRIWKQAPLLASQILTVLSEEVDVMRVPSLNRVMEMLVTIAGENHMVPRLLVSTDS